MTEQELIRGKRVLVVDDEPWVTEVLAEMLAADGHEVDTAANGRIALTHVQRRAYDLIISDIRMPELDGLGLYTELQRGQPLLLRRFIFVTGSGLSSEIQKFLDRTGARRLHKPFTVQDLHQMTQAALGAR